MSQTPYMRDFVARHFKHFNAAALEDAAKGYEAHLADGGKMMITLAGAMSTAELGRSLAEMIRQDKVAIISLVHLALAGPHGCEAWVQHFGERRGREAIQRMSVIRGLDRLRLRLLAQV